MDAIESSVCTFILVMYAYIMRKTMLSGDKDMGSRSQLVGREAREKKKKKKMNVADID